MFTNPSFATVKSALIYVLPVLFLIGSFFSSLIPPFQSPDEQDHLKRAYFLSKGRVAMETPAGHSTGGLIDTGLNSYMSSFQYIAGKQEKKLTASVQQKAESIKWSGEEQFGPCPGVNYYFPLIYLPQALALTVGQILDLTVSQSYYLARYMALLSSLVIILVAFAVHRPSLFIIAILSMPLMLFQLVATSQDGFAIALVVLAGSLFLRLTITKHPFNSTCFYVLCGSILLLTTSRINLVPMLILPFVANYIASKSIKYYLVSAGIVSLSVAWILYALATTVDNRIETGASTAEILIYYAKNPFAFIGVLINTLQDSRTVHFYVGSFIGVLGWLDTSIGDVYIGIICVSLLIIFLSSISIKSIQEHSLSRAMLLLVSFASILMTFFLLLITWNKHPAEIIQGVQGRYFWAPLILLGLSLTSEFGSVSGIKKWIMSGALLCIVLINVLITPKVLLSRYYLGFSSSSAASVPVILKEKTIIIEPKNANIIAEKGGFIDSSEYKNSEIVIVGWGHFDQDDKVLLTNKSHAISARYITVERPDVVNAMGEDKFIYAGFEIRIPVENEQEAKSIMDNLCLYSNNVAYGMKQLISGSRNTLYKCGLNQ